MAGFFKTSLQNGYPYAQGQGNTPLYTACHSAYTYAVAGGQRYLTRSRRTQQNFHMVRGNVDAVEPPLLPTPQPSVPSAAALFGCLHTSGRLGGGQKG